MARRTNRDKGKESLALLGVKIDPALKSAIEDEGNALGVPMSTYARQLLITGWQSRHNAPISKNPRESILLEWFNDLPIREQENVLIMVEALYKKHVLNKPILHDTPIPTEQIDPLAAMIATGHMAKKGGKR